MAHAREVTRTEYEWDHESYDEFGDIIDHDFSDKYPGIPTEDNVELVLVKNVARGLAGEEYSFMLDDRAWAYVVDGALPEQFTDGSKVPVRFHKMIK
jgi:hypothetical protein